MEQRKSIKEQVNDAVEILNNLDEYVEMLPAELSQADSAICDLLHLIENNKLKTSQCYRVIQELHRIRVERRRIKNDMEISNTYKLHWQKLLNKDNRAMLITELTKKENHLKVEYNNRIYTEEEIQKLLGEKEEEKNE